MHTQVSNRNITLWIPTLLLLGVFLWIAANFPHDSLWYDETVNAYLATSSWGTIWDWSRNIDNQMPLHFWLLKLWIGPMGESEFSLRLFSAFCGLLAAGGVFALGKRLIGNLNGGLLATLLFAGSGGFLYAAGEVRTYGLALALLIWSCVLLWELWCDPSCPSKKLLIGYLIITLMLVYAHYTAWLAVAAQAIFVGAGLLQARFKGLRLAVLMLAGLALGYLPWAIALAGRDFNAGTAFYGEVSWQTAFEAYTGFAIFGQKILTDSAREIIWGVVGCTVVGLLIWAITGLSRKDNFQNALTNYRLNNLIFVGALLIIPLAGLIISVNQIEAKLSGRHAWAVWPAIALAIAGGLSIFSRLLPMKWAQIGLIGVALIGMAWLFDTGEQLEDEYTGEFRQAFEILEREADPDDILILQDGTLFTAAEYYNSPISYMGIPRDKLTNVNHEVQIYEAIDSLNLILKPATRHIWVMAWQGNTMDPTMLAFALPEYLSDGQRRVWMGSDAPDVYSKLVLVEYEISAGKQPLLDHIIAYPGTLQVQPDGPSLLGFDVFTSFNEQANSENINNCSVMVHTWWWSGETDYPATMTSVTLFGPDEERIAQRDQPIAGYTFGQEKWTPFVPILGRVELKYPCEKLVASEEYAIWLAVYDTNGEKETQTYLLTEFIPPR